MNELKKVWKKWRNKMADKNKKNDYTSDEKQNINVKADSQTLFFGGSTKFK